MRYGMLTLIGWLLLGSPLFAGKFNKVLSIGDAAPVWKDLPGTDDKKHSLDALREREFVVVVFTCNSCACSEEYEERIIAFAKKYAPKVALVAINVNTIADDRLDAMKKKAEKKKFPFPYLYDETQKIGTAYGAKYTPEFFILNKERKVVYMGAMDDKSKEADVQHKYLEDALDALLKGNKPPIEETAAFGCLVRYKRMRE
jgi:peroxiredoxin